MREQHDACRRDRRADEIVPLKAVAEKHDPEADGEEHLQLDHQRCQAGGHAQLDAEEQQSELATPIAKP